MSITTFAELKTAVSNYLKGRNDIDDRIDEFIALGEKRINRRLRVEEMMSTSTTASAATVTLPTDLLEIDSVVLQSDPKVVLESLEKRVAARDYPFTTTGKPVAYRVRDGSLLMYPSPQDTTNIVIEYFARPTALSTSNTTNTIFPLYADLFLYAAMVEAMVYLYDDQRLPVWKGLFDEGIEDANRAATRKRLRGVRLRPAYGAGE